MGFPLSPIVANVYMEAFQKQGLVSSTLNPKSWLRYVDDTFVVWPHDSNSLKKFHLHLNAQHCRIQFTKEEERERKLPFLDALLVRGDTIYNTVYHKPTRIDRYLHYLLHHHARQLQSCVRSLRERVINNSLPTKHIKNSHMYISFSTPMVMPSHWWNDFFLRHHQQSPPRKLTRMMIACKNQNAFTFSMWKELVRKSSKCAVD